MKKGTVVIACTCKHDYQDKQYGKQRRIANITSKGTPEIKEVRCTVCNSMQKVDINK